MQLFFLEKFLSVFCTYFQAMQLTAKIAQSTQHVTILLIPAATILVVAGVGNGTGVPRTGNALLDIHIPR